MSHVEEETKKHIQDIGAPEIKKCIKNAMKEEEKYGQISNIVDLERTEWYLFLNGVPDSKMGSWDSNVEISTNKSCLIKQKSQCDQRQAHSQTGIAIHSEVPSYLWAGEAQKSFTPNLFVPVSSS